MSEQNPNGYRVLARKYRPDRFSELIGQEALVRTLGNALTLGRLAHAFVLTGVRGVGKTSTARLLARGLNCIGEDGNGEATLEPCGTCEPCQAIGAGRHVDVLEIDAASHTGVDDAREIIEGVGYRPVSARFKIYIIDEVHMMSKSAFNALLKTLEEPPDNVKFIFATTEIRKVPVTILSRCQRFDLRRVPADELAGHLTRICERENINAEAEAVTAIARAAEGSVRDALSLLDQAAAMTADRLTIESVTEMLGRPGRSDSIAILDAAMRGDVPDELAAAILDWKSILAADPQKLATRVASQKTLEAILPACPTLFGGSADLTGSNNTKVADHSIFDRDNYSGTYIHYGVREHGMAAVMNGIALHGGAIPYGGTFMVFTDYCRPSIRLSALMQQRAIYVMTHDSIGLGEDGPTHQPVEHLAALRVIPNLLVFRPGDAVETAEAWQCAIEAANTPSILALSRQGMAQFRHGDMAENKTALGGYIIAGDDAGRQVTLIASGSEVGIALAARNNLEKEGIATTVVSMPCMELFRSQEAAYQTSILGSAPRIVIEAAMQQSWDWLLGREDGFIGMNGFGASAPIGDLYAHFGITEAAVVAAVHQRLS